MSLKELLEEPYSLAMAPGFFRVYAHTGVLLSLEEHGLLHPSAVSGSSAGAMSAGFYAAGLTPKDMIERILKIDRPAIWDASPFTGFGLLQGLKLRQIIHEQLPVKTFEECVVPLGMTAFDVFGMRTRKLLSGDISTNMAASACFPVLFQPVSIDGRPHIDAGIFDEYGMVSLPLIPSTSKLIVNVVFDYDNKGGGGLLGGSRDVCDIEACVPKEFLDQGARLLTICVNGLCAVHPWNMEVAGRKSFMQAKVAVDKALGSSGEYRIRHRQALAGANNAHWVVYIDVDAGDGAIDNNTEAAPLTEAARGASPLQLVAVSPAVQSTTEQQPGRRSSSSRRLSKKRSLSSRAAGAVPQASRPKPQAVRASAPSMKAKRAQRAAANAF